MKNQLLFFFCFCSRIIAVSDQRGRIEDEALYEKPPECVVTRMELILGQYRHFMCHIGIFNGITIANTGRYPMVAGLDELREHGLDGRLFDE